MVEAVQEGRKIILGRLGEHITRVKKFNIGNLLAQYPGAVFTVLNRRPGEESAYAVAASHCEIDGNCLLWTIHIEDVALPGKGRCELHMQSGDGVYKSYIWDTEVLEALDGSSEAPEPWQPLVDEIVVAANEARDAATNAAASAGEAASAAESAASAARTMSFFMFVLFLCLGCSDCHEVDFVVGDNANESASLQLACVRWGRNRRDSRGERCVVRK